MLQLIQWHRRYLIYLLNLFDAFQVPLQHWQKDQMQKLLTLALLVNDKFQKFSLKVTPSNKTFAPLLFILFVDNS